jgi:hypothetical protein
MFERVRASDAAAVGAIVEPSVGWRSRRTEVRVGRIVHVLSRFPGAELAIHRLCAHDGAFRAICEDYEEAVAALRRWEAADEAKAADFRRLASEIEAEIAAFLDEPGEARRPPG